MNKFDFLILEFIRSFGASSDAIHFMGVFCARTLLPVMFAAVILGSYFMRRQEHIRGWEISIHALLAAGLGFVVREIIGAAFFRPRPFIAHAFEPLISLRWMDASFPSGHATVAFALAATVMRYDRLWGSLFVVFAVLVAWGRVFVGVHYPSDVIAGAILGIAAAYAIKIFEEREWKKIGYRVKSHR